MPKINNNFKKLLVGFFFVSAGFANAQIPNIPIPDNLNILLQQNGILVEVPPTAALAKRACCGLKVFKKVKKGITNAGSSITSTVYDGGQLIGSTVADGAQYVLDGTDAVVSSVAGGVQWTSSKVADGVDFVVVKTAEGTVWTVNTGLEGVELVVRETAAGLSWSVEKSIPERAAIGGITYVRLDPVKNVVKAGIGYSVNISATTISAAQATSEYVIQTSAGVATGAVDGVSGSLNLSLDILTFSVSNTAAIASAMVDLDAKKVVSESWTALLAATTNILNWGDLGWCGSNNTWKNTLATNVLVTDYWPPDEQVTNLLSTQAQQCRIFGLARLYKGCIIHDACYSVPGKTKQMCDNEAHKNWKNACSAAYGSSGYCYKNCIANVDFFHYMLATADAEPFTRAQDRAAKNIVLATKAINDYNDAKTRYNYTSIEYPLFTEVQPASYVPQKFITLMPKVDNVPIVAPILIPLLLQ